MLNLSQAVVDNLSLEGRLEVAAHALNAANATVRDLAEQLVGAKVLLRATSAALSTSRGLVDQLMIQVKEQAADVRTLRRALADTDRIIASKARTIEHQAAQLDKLQVETAQAQCAVRGYPQMVDMLVLNQMWAPLLGDRAAEIDQLIRQGGRSILPAIKQVRSCTGFTLVLCRVLVKKRAEYL
jgi:septal ring factor EnvC (AmiA/AmiB activator)